MCRRVIAELPRARDVELEVHGGAAVLVEGGLGVGQIVAGDHRSFIDDVEDALLFGIGQQLVARSGVGVLVAGAAEHLVEGQFGRGADDALQLFSGFHARHFDQDAVGALTLDRRLARAGGIDTAANDLKTLLHGAGVGRGLFRRRQADQHRAVVLGDHDVGLADAGQAGDRAGQFLHPGNRGSKAGAVGHRNPQHIGGRGLAPDGAGLIAHILQGVAHFGPQAVHALLVHIRQLHLGQKMRAAAQVKTQIDQRIGQERGPAGDGRRLLCRRLGPRLEDGVLSVVVAFNPTVKQVRRGHQQASGHDGPNEKAFPERGKHRVSLWQPGRDRSWTRPG